MPKTTAPTTLRDHIAAEEVEVAKKERPKKPFRRKAKVIISNPHVSLVGRFATVTRCKGRMEKTYDRDAKEYFRRRVFYVTLTVDGVSDPVDMTAANVELADGFNVDSIRDLIERHVARDVNSHRLSHESVIKRLDDGITALLDDSKLQEQLYLSENDIIAPVEHTVEDDGNRVRMGFGPGFPTPHTTPYINIYMNTSRYDSRLEISFSSFTATPAQLMAYARAIEAAAQHAIALRVEALHRLNGYRAAEQEKLANVQGYIDRMAADFQLI